MKIYYCECGRAYVGNDWAVVKCTCGADLTIRKQVKPAVKKEINRGRLRPFPLEEKKEKSQKKVDIGQFFS